MAFTPITIRTTIAAAPTFVWDCYTQPEHITQWNFATDDWCCPYATNDLRVGGKYSARMEAKDGSFGFDFEAVYDAITPYNSFTYTMPDNRRVHFSLTPLPGHATEVVIVFDAETENSIELQRDGWQAILHSFKDYTERLVR